MDFFLFLTNNKLMKPSNYLFGISIIIVMIAVWFVARPDKKMENSSSTTEIQKDAPLFVSFENLIDGHWTPDTKLMNALFSANDDEEN